MDEFSTSRPANLRNEGSGFWTLGAVVVILLLVVAIIGLGSTGSGTATDAVTSPETAPTPVITE